MTTMASEAGDVAAPLGEDSPLHPSPTNATIEKKKAEDRITKEMQMLPTAQEIHGSIPSKGISIAELVSKYETRLTESNVNLFTQLIRAVAEFSTKTWRDKKQKITSVLLDPIQITFDETSELIRAMTKRLPPSLYRVFYETSATLCSYVNEHTHPEHRDSRSLKIASENAFQAIGPFNSLTANLTRQRIERHLGWNIKKDPSSYISAFNAIEDAERRAGFHFKKSGRIGWRLSVAEIRATDLVPATIRAKLEETIKTFNDQGTFADQEKITRNVEIPIWVRATAVPQDRSSISEQQLSDSGADIWLSITELRISDLQLSSKKGHDYEWLAFGRIPKSCIVKEWIKQS
ncbi:hypothetical protein BDV95DRAFT_614810 [Massariosphaeria phaeospora]|uniref:Uncharacterized protein n=1 Tax=Massariosphaeria phaeospora TaxID=100035 RepID=A0A7C8IQI7_9PLEO|nr:hypothetical protein BDV95DRAFT_614810 [Massariosphaeria phaeospora]